MKTKVSVFVEDTDSQFLDYIGDWLNDKYQLIWRKMSWSSVIKNNYTFDSVASTAEYNLPLDFDQELFVANVADGQKLERYTEALWWEERNSAYQADVISPGEYPLRYVILREAINTTHTGFGKILLDPTPSSVKTFAMPYKRKWRKLISISETCTTDTASKVIAAAGTFITDGVEVGMVIKNTSDNTYGYVVSVDSETQITADWDICPDGNEIVTIQNLVIIPDIDYILEYGALTEAYAYKKFFQKSDYYAMKFETELNRRIGQEKAQPNQRYQNIPDNRDSSNFGRPLTGWSSYNSL